MSPTPPFRRGQAVETDWPRTGRWEPCVVERCEPASYHTQTGWIVWVEGGLPMPWSPKRGRVNGVDSGWFRERRP